MSDDEGRNRKKPTYLDMILNFATSFSSVSKKKYLGNIESKHSFPGLSRISFVRK